MLTDNPVKKRLTACTTQGCPYKRSCARSRGGAEVKQSQCYSYVKHFSPVGKKCEHYVKKGG